MSERLWDKGAAINDFIHDFTVGNDPELDEALVYYDCLGSAAHVHALHQLELLSDDEAGKLIASLRRISADEAFEIPHELEDCHTAIEARLTQEHGDLGKKIHAGRSRNDQVATAARLYMRQWVTRWFGLLNHLFTRLDEQLERNGHLPLPGHTHLRSAMPSTIGMWLHSVMVAVQEQQYACLDLLERLDSCPLGTAAGFGSPLPLDRELTARLLGFSGPQLNPIDVQNSRGRMELYYTRVAGDIGTVIERLASDLMLYCLPEFGFVDLPEELTTGSSIMPQKRNPDVLELMRAHGARLKSASFELQCVTGKLTSSYHRDLQLTKPPMVSVTGAICTLTEVAARTVKKLSFNEDRLRAAMTPELYATHAAVQQVLRGVPFRDAYRAVAAEPDRDWKSELPAEVVESAGRLEDAIVEQTRTERVALDESCRTWQARLKAVPEMVFAMPVPASDGAD